MFKSDNTVDRQQNLHEMKSIGQDNVNALLCQGQPVYARLKQVIQELNQVYYYWECVDENNNVVATWPHKFRYALKDFELDDLISTWGDVIPMEKQGPANITRLFN